MSPSAKAIQHCLVTSLANKQTMFWTTFFFFLVHYLKMALDYTVGQWSCLKPLVLTETTHSHMASVRSMNQWGWCDFFTKKNGGLGYVVSYCAFGGTLKCVFLYCKFQKYLEMYLKRVTSSCFLLLFLYKLFYKWQLNLQRPTKRQLVY